MDVLVVDDEKEIADLVELYLANEGFAVHKFNNGADAIKCIDTSHIDLALLDVMLPDIDGFSICRHIRKTANYPVIMLTARVEDIDKINGLSIGADDYITKPFNPLEMTARVKAQLRRYTRYNTSAPQEICGYDSRGLVVNYSTHVCSLNGRDVSLTPTEFNILRLLCENCGNVVSAEEIFEKVWGEKYLDSNNTVMVHIRRLREKLGEPNRNPRFIKTVWGVGYKIEK